MLKPSDGPKSGFGVRVFLWGGAATLLFIGLIFLYVPQAPESVGQEASIREYQAGAVQSQESPSETQANVGLSSPSRSSEEIYGTYCAQCHGQTGEGDGPMSRMMSSKPPNLKIGPFKMERSPEALAQIFRNGLGAMPGFQDEISQDEALALGQFVLQMEESAP